MEEMQLTQEILIGVLAFSAIILTLVVVILLARRLLVPSNQVSLTINQQKQVQCATGKKLLYALGDNSIYLPSACGGGGTCGQCRVIVEGEAGEVLATEKNHLTRHEQESGYRLACQMTVREPLSIKVPDAVLGANRYECEVVSNRNIATFIKELVLAMPEGKELAFRAGGYVQITCPPYHCSFHSFDIPQVYRAEWDRYNLWRYEAASDKPTTRAYSMANYPDENSIIMLNVRIATPPPKAPDLPPGVVSSYIFNLKPGDKVMVAGPFGEFFAKDTQAEMVFVGAGAGIAPMRSHILDQLKRIKSGRKISFWYGARSLCEMPYVDEFNALSEQHENFSWDAALSNPQPEDNWQGFTGYIHEVMLENYLRQHPAPEECEFYLCGPPLMVSATISMLEDLGVERDNILLDDFGG